jgi:hypothetical protein
VCFFAVSFAMACADDGGPEAFEPPDGGGLRDGETDNATDAEIDAGPEAATPPPCSDDGFCHTALPAEMVLRDVWGDGTGIVWSVTEQGNVLRWDGSSWSIAHTVPGALFAIWGSGPTDIWIGGEHGLAHGQGATSKDLVWTDVDVPGLDGILLASIWGSGASDIWAVGGRSDPMVSPPSVEGRALHYAGAAAGWTIEAVSAQEVAFTKVWGTGPQDVWIGGFDFESFPINAGTGRVFQLDPASGSFSELALPTVERGGQPAGIERVTGGATIGDSLVVLSVTQDWGSYVLGAPGDGGTLAWTDETFKQHPSHELHAVFGADANDVWVAGEYGRLRHWDGAAWSLPRIAVSKMPVLDDFYAIWAQSNDELWFVGDRIALHKRPKKD